MTSAPTGAMRQFETGATRHTDQHKIDFEGFLCPRVLEAYGDYMTKHQQQADGTLRASDNWQKGIPQAVYIKSAWRHFHQLWKHHRGLLVTEQGQPVTRTDALCGLLFNIMGYLHEELKAAPNQAAESVRCCGGID